MSKPVDCQVFQDQLDSLVEGRLSSEGIEALHLHARSCPDCEALLRMHEHVASPSQADLEAAVPDEYVEEMWPRVQRAIAERERAALREIGDRRRWRWLVPTLAAACLALLVGAAVLLAQLVQFRNLEQALSLQLAQQAELLAELKARTPHEGESMAAVYTSGGLATVRRLQRALSGRERVTFSELRDLIAKLPPETQILDARGTKTAIRRVSPWGPLAFREYTKGITTDDGLQAGEALGFIEALALNPNASISTDRLVALSKDLLRAGAFTKEGEQRS